MLEVCVCPASTAFTDAAQAMAERWNLGFASQPSGELALMLDEQGLALHSLSEPKMGAVRVDFAAPELTYRQQHGGGKKEPIAKAVGIKGNTRPNVLDATAGLGRDAFVLASLGCQVQMLERSPVVAALLDDGLRRAAENPATQALAERMQLLHGDSASDLAKWPGEAPQAIYLDPMFPHRRKAALVKKEMQLLQRLLGTDADADSLLAPSLALATQRVVVKRPNSAPVLASRQPQLQITGKKHRFDVYLRATL